MEIRASEDAAHIENLEAENAKLRAALETILRCTHHDDVLEVAREALGRNEE